MPGIDWSQFVPNLIVAFIGALFALVSAGAIAYFRSERFKRWLNRLPVAFARGSKWLVERWYFFLPLFIVVILGAIAFRLYGDWIIVVFSVVCYVMGLLGWGLSSIRRLIFGRNKAIGVTGTGFLPIPLPAGMGNAYLRNRYLDPPVGDVVLGGVQFHFGQDSLIFDTNEQIRVYIPRDDGGKEIELRLPEPVNRVKSVHLLINSGNSQVAYANTSIGEIRLVFRDAPPIDVELILGKNIREWCPGNPGNYVRETSSPEVAAGVWTGMGRNGANAVIDCLRIPVYGCMRGCFLERIVIVHRCVPQPPDTMGVHFAVFGVSAEIEQVVQSKNAANDRLQAAGRGSPPEEDSGLENGRKSQSKLMIAGEEQ